jgi:hypothetical protein
VSADVDDIHGEMGDSWPTDENEGLRPWMSVTTIFPALGFVRGDVSPSVSAPDRLKR